MKIAPLHSWDVDPAEARELQERLSARVDTASPLASWKTVAAADVSYSTSGDWQYAAVVVVRAGTLERIERAGVVVRTTFPYIPGLLSFRETPGVLEAFRKLGTRPDVVLCDGQGTAHPRRFGLACHLGLWLDLPTIGCAKSRLWGEYEEPGLDRGDRSPLVDQGEIVGEVVRTRAGVKPLFVSPGHRCDLESAVAVTLATALAYRLPAPARLAHAYGNDIRRAVVEGRPPPL